MELTKLLKPKSMAVIGASEKEGFGGDVCRNIISYTENLEKVYFVNPKRDTIFDRKCYKSITEIPNDIDLMIICTPQKTILPLLEEGAKKGCGGAVIYASGYGETGTEEGRKKEKELLERAEKLKIAIMGPNCAGFVNYTDNIHAFAFISEKRERKGSIGVISQSGQLCLSMMDCPFMKFSYNISAGNAKGIQMEDYMEYLVEDENTKVISLYMEGVNNAAKFVNVLNKAAQKKKPIIVLKVGRSDKGQKIAASHTGSLSGSDASFDALLKKFGVIRVEDLEELAAMSSLLSTIPKLPDKTGFASMNLSGGETAICADVGYLNEILYPDFTPETLAALKKLLPVYATPNNPLDTTATLSYDTDLYAAVLETVMDDPNIGMVLIGYTLLYEIADPAIYYMYEGIKKVILKKGSQCKPVAIIPFTENTRNAEYQEKLFEIGVPVLPTPIYAFKMLKKLVDYVDFDYSVTNHSIAIPQRKSNKTYALSEHESKMDLKNFGVSVPEEIIVTSRQAAEKAMEKFQTAYAMKIESSDILHKSDVGGVILNITSSHEAGEAYNQIIKNINKNCPTMNINGVLMAPMLEAGLEMIIGVNNDSQFGPIVMVGMGGVFVELFGDVAVYPAPINTGEAMNMLKSLKIYKMLNGYRGGTRYDIAALCKIIVSVGDFAVENKDTLKELDINPLFVHPEGKGVSPADSLIVKYGEKL